MMFCSDDLVMELENTTGRAGHTNIVLSPNVRDKLDKLCRIELVSCEVVEEVVIVEIFSI